MDTRPSRFYLLAVLDGARCSRYKSLIILSMSKKDVDCQKCHKSLYPPPHYLSSDSVIHFQFYKISKIITFSNLCFFFPPVEKRCGKLQPPVISFTDVAFSYSGKREDYLFSGLNFGIDSDSRIALVGPNGAGKSTLLKVASWGG